MPAQTDPVCTTRVCTEEPRLAIEGECVQLGEQDAEVLHMFQLGCTQVERAHSDASVRQLLNTEHREDERLAACHDLGPRHSRVSLTRPSLRGTVWRGYQVLEYCAAGVRGVVV